MHVATVNAARVASRTPLHTWGHSLAYIHRTSPPGKLPFNGPSAAQTERTWHHGGHGSPLRNLLEHVLHMREGRLHLLLGHAGGQLHRLRGAWEGGAGKRRRKLG